MHFNPIARNNLCKTYSWTIGKIILLWLSRLLIKESHLFSRKMSWRSFMFQYNQKNWNPYKIIHQFHNHIEWMGLNWPLNFDIDIYLFQYHLQIPCNYNNFIMEASNSHPNNNYMKILMDPYLIGIIFEHNNLNF